MGRVTRSTEVNNFDDSLGLYWYEKLDENPDQALASIALSFTQHISSHLGINPSSVHWFAKADAAYAAGCRRASDDAQPSPLDDPVLYSCPYFRISDPGGIVHHGMTPFFSCGHVLIQTGLSSQDTLKAIAHECYHLYQDWLRGPQWRQDHYEVAETEAAGFADSQMNEIESLLSPVD